MGQDVHRVSSKNALTFSGSPWRSMTLQSLKDMSAKYDYCLARQLTTMADISTSD